MEMLPTGVSCGLVFPEAICICYGLLGKRLLGRSLSVRGWLGVGRPGFDSRQG
jgi:hypothetical protein